MKSSVFWRWLILVALMAYLFMFSDWLPAVTHNLSNVSAMNGWSIVGLDSVVREKAPATRVIHASTAIQNGDLLDAEAELRSITQSRIALDERGVISMFHLASVLAKQGKFIEAGDVWRQAGLASTPARFCDFMLRNQNLELASVWCRGLPEIAQDGWNYCLRAEYLRRSQMYVEAEQDFQAAVELNDASPECLVDFGRLLHSQQRYEEALYAFEGAVGRDPQPAYLVELGSTLFRLDRLDRAREVLMTAYAQSVTPQDRSVSAITLGTILYFEGAYPQARHYVVEGLLAIDVLNPSAYRSLARIERQLGDHEKAITAYQNAIAGLGENPNPMFLAYRHELAKYLIELERLGEARAMYQEILRIASDDSEALEALD